MVPGAIVGEKTPPEPWPAVAEDEQEARSAASAAHTVIAIALRTLITSLGIDRAHPWAGDQASYWSVGRAGLVHDVGVGPDQATMLFLENSVSGSVLPPGALRCLMVKSPDQRERIGVLRLRPAG